MSVHGRADLFARHGQADLFGAEVAPAYRPDPDRVRARLHRILVETRARSEPWN